MTTETSLVPWLVIFPDRPQKSFFLCPAHDEEELSGLDKLNDDLRGDGISVARYQTPPGGALAVRVSLPPGARCAACYQDPPCENQR
jgi:hypothetical protein